MDARRTIVLITGGTSSSTLLLPYQNKHELTHDKGNAGIGFELAAQLLADPSKHVLLGSRSVEKGEAAVKELKSRKQPGTVELLQLDVASGESITAAAKRVESEHGRYRRLHFALSPILPPSSQLFNHPMTY